MTVVIQTFVKRTICLNACGCPFFIEYDNKGWSFWVNHTKFSGGSGSDAESNRVKGFEYAREFLDKLGADITRAEELLKKEPQI